MTPATACSKSSRHRLRENLRDVDIAARRLGGDEFAIVLEGLSSEEEAVATAEQAATSQRLLEALTQEAPARLQGYEIACTGSIGIAIYPDHGETGGELMQHADRAMYRAKQNGRDGYQLYSDKDGESRSGVLERLQFESSIRHALERNQYVVFFQPQMTLDRKRLVGMEALVRWQHPELGLVPPGASCLFWKARASSRPWESGCCGQPAGKSRNGRTTCFATCASR